MSGSLIGDLTTPSVVWPEADADSEIVRSDAVQVDVMVGVPGIDVLTHSADRAR